MVKNDNMMLAFIFDSGRMGNFYGEEVFRMMLCGNELLNNDKKIVVSWGDILTNKRYFDIEPYILKDEYCTINLLKADMCSFSGTPYCWIIEDIDGDIANLIDKRLKETVKAYIGLSRIDKSNIFQQKQFWKDMIRSICYIIPTTKIEEWNVDSKSVSSVGEYRENWSIIDQLGE